MHIKSIVLDGFKSYGNRVEVTGFDHQFNAITGLNGSGKSNILDSICFVLGITNLSNVRAGSLQELIYKHGQAGITKATVSITFDNRDKNQCPMGYENHDEITVTRQVVMGGKNKYLINGIYVQNKRVNDLFCSVQLNVNNPHFLIMQGRITKVLNMKPPEILSMVEEAAGTRMYEAKKQAAQKTIEKKDAKLRELNDIIREDIAPKLQKLQDERSQYQEYQKVVRELENLTRLHVAWRYVSAEESAKEAADKVVQVQEEIKRNEETVKENEAKAKDIDQQVAELNRKLDEESGSILKQLETELQEVEKSEATASAAHKAAQEAVSSGQKKSRLLAKALADDEAALAAKKKGLDEVTATFASLKSASESSEAALAEAQQRFLAVSSGKEDSSDSLQDQLIAAKKEASEASTNVTQRTMEKQHLESRAAALRKEFQAGSQQFQRDQEQVGGRRRQLEKMQSEVGKLQFSEERHGQLKERLRGLQQRQRQQRDEVDRRGARLQRCSFAYSAPSPAFDHGKVFGPLCRLFDVPDPKYCTALEAVAGGRLYNPVVDSEVTAKLLLDRGELRERTTFVPLNKISASVIEDAVVRRAQNIVGAENVELALNLVQFAGGLRPAMAFAFGGSLVCEDMAVATRLANDPAVRRRCVTLLGDVVDPAGTMAGGALQQGDSVLLPLRELRAAEKELQQIEQELKCCNEELSGMQRAADEYHALKQKWEEMSHEVRVIEQRLATTSHAQLHREIETLQAQIERLTGEVQSERERQSAAAARAATLEDKVKDIRGHREREFARAKAGLEEARRAAEQHGGAWKRREQELETLRLEVHELDAAVLAGQRQLADTAEAAQRLAAAADDAQRQRSAASEAVAAQQKRVKQQRTALAARGQQAGKLQRDADKLRADAEELRLAARTLAFRADELRADANKCDQTIAALEREHAWVREERQYFGRAGGLYDWAGKEFGVVGQRLKQLGERRERLARGLNARAHALLGKEEEQYQDVLRKRRIVEADRAKLVQVMAELDDKKRRTLLAACHQVNRDFGSIFGTLLPGAQAELRPPPDLSVLDGLEIRVGFNSQWKESLGELSGGQRSLVALSLVLAMLLHKPAPLYILDEVDAALDLSHTQNIGQMLRDHFKHSQFIIVSLKDGMFNNANVLFRTKFVDGMSTVQRTVNQRR